MTNPASQQPAPIPERWRILYDAVIPGSAFHQCVEELALAEAMLGGHEELLFVSNVMSGVAQGVTGAAKEERRLAERIANKYRAAALSTPLGTPGKGEK